jgi:hypothetical protein
VRVVRCPGGTRLVELYVLCTNTVGLGKGQRYGYDFTGTSRSVFKSLSHSCSMSHCQHRSCIVVPRCVSQLRSGTSTHEVLIPRNHETVKERNRTSRVRDTTILAYSRLICSNAQEV